MSNISKAFLLKKYNSKGKRNNLELYNFLAFIIVVSISIFSILSLGQLRTYAQEVPTEGQIKASFQDQGQNSKIYDRNGIILYTFKDPVRDREYVNYSEIPPTVIASILAGEDKNFFLHEGIDYIGTLRALVTNGTSGGTVLGGSTITQQLVKQTILSNERTIDRKIKEAIISLFVEKDYTKSQILEYYLNVSDFGGRIRGIKTASQTYFHKSLDKLTLGEAAYLVGLVQAPGEYSPLFSVNKQKALELSINRRDHILDQINANPRFMAYLNSNDINYLHRNEFDKVDPAAGITKPNYTSGIVLNFKKEQYNFVIPRQQLLAPHWVFYIMDLIQSAPYNLTTKDLYSGGYSIYTSLDLNIQKLAEQKVAAGVAAIGPNYGFENGSLVTIDATTGEILAMVGSKDYYLANNLNDKKFNPEVNVTTARRSLGSSLKPFVAYLGFQSGKFTPNTVMQDSPQTFYGNYRPKDSDGRFVGAITVHDAILQSRNLPFLKMDYAIGDWQLPDLMHKIGYRTDSQYGLAATIGGVDETLLDHVGAYTGLANGGNVMTKKPILRIINADNSVKYQSTTTILYKLDPNLVAQVDGMIGDKNYTVDTAWAKFIGNQKLAGKTGTSDENKDTYYMGFGPKVVTGIWCGNNDNTPLIAEAFGSHTAIFIWHDYMQSLFNQFPQYSVAGSY